MNKWDISIKLMDCFPNSFINHNGEFIAHKKANEYFYLGNCETELDVKCKVLEWLSRGACKTEPYRTKKTNEQFHRFMLDGINKFLETGFTEEQMYTIYTYLGNSINHKKTIKFIESGYDFSVLGEE